MSEQVNSWPISTVLFVDDSSDEIFLADFSFKKENIDCELKHFVDFASFEAQLEAMSAAELKTSIAVIDLNLTVSKGSDGIADLRTQERYKGLILGICSGSDDPADRQSSLQAGADFFVTKPLNAEALITVCEQVPLLKQRNSSEGQTAFVRVAE